MCVDFWSFFVTDSQGPCYTANSSANKTIHSSMCSAILYSYNSKCSDVSGQRITQWAHLIIAGVVLCIISVFIHPIKSNFVWCA